MSLKCPRCPSKSIVTKEKDMNVDGVTIQVNQHTCSACGSVFYFEEQILSYIHAIINSASKQKGSK